MNRALDLGTSTLRLCLMATGSPVCPRCVMRTRALVAFFATKQNPFLTFFPFLPLCLSNNKPGRNLQLTCSSLVSPTFSV